MHVVMISYYIGKKFEKLIECLRYGESRYKLKDNVADKDDGVRRKDPCAKVMWYM